MTPLQKKFLAWFEVLVHDSSSYHRLEFLEEHRSQSLSQALYTANVESLRTAAAVFLNRSQGTRTCALRNYFTIHLQLGKTESLQRWLRSVPKKNCSCFNHFQGNNIAVTTKLFVEANLRRSMIQIDSIAPP